MSKKNLKLKYSFSFQEILWLLIGIGRIMAHLTRYYMYENIKKVLIKNSCFPIQGNVLGISGINSFYKMIDMKKSEMTETEYPNLDMQNLPYSDDRFDFVISDQVVEHLEDPQKAIKESYRVLNSGGIAIHTTCFINSIHFCPNDFYRFSPDGLKYLCNDFSEMLICNGWGNRIAILLCFLSDKFRFKIIPDKRWSLWRYIASYNEKEYPIVTWVIAKK